MRLISKIVCSALFTVLLACSSSSERSDDVLYQDLGGNAGIDKMIGAVLDRIYADERIAFLFQDTDRENLHRLLVEQVCDLTGGPCDYSGLDMVAAHSGLDLKHSEFEVFVEDVTRGMEDVGIPFTVQNRLLAIFAPMQSDVIHK